jgi:hypothetical protein
VRQTEAEATASPSRPAQFFSLAGDPPPPRPSLTPHASQRPTLALPLPPPGAGRCGGRRGNGLRVLGVLAPSFSPSRVAMYDCMESFVPGPRRLYGAAGPGAGLLRRATGSSCFAGLESFAWAQPASLQCRYSSSEIGCWVHERLVLTISLCKVWDQGTRGYSGPFYMRYWPFKHEGLQSPSPLRVCCSVWSICGFYGGCLARASVDAPPESLGERPMYVASVSSSP